MKNSEELMVVTEAISLGLDGERILDTQSHFEQILAQAMVQELDEIETRRRKNLAVDIANNLGKVLGGKGRRKAKRG